MELWNSDIEVKFFNESLKNFASKEQLFYKLDDGYYAYIPKGVDGFGQTLQSRNTLIGKFTEKWVKSVLEPVARDLGLFAVNGIVCNDIGLTSQSNADLAFCTTNDIVQKSENIKIIFEVKMSIVSNYIYKNNKINFIGDFKSHKGTPSILRSDSMLKAIGKSLNIRVSGNKSNKIPIIVLGNSPITKNYEEKVDYLKKSGVIQGFWSFNPVPTSDEFIKETKNKGFQTFDNLNNVAHQCKKIISNDMFYFSSMMSKSNLGDIISKANNENSSILKAEKFLELINHEL